MYGSPPVTGVKKVVDDPIGPFKKTRDDTPTGPFKKIRDEGPPRPFKKIRDDVQIKKVADDIRVPVPVRPRPGGLAPFLLSTGHHADVDDAAAAAGAELQEAAAAVDEARRNVVALQTALTGATTELARAQDRLEAVMASLQSME
jgi:hypothetical protein